MARFVLIAVLLCAALPLRAQELVFATVERPPFSFNEGGQMVGFSIDLMRAISAEMGAEVRFEPKPSFAEMLSAVERAEVDGAIANISITGGREAVMDFTLPIFRSGLQIMVHAEDGPSRLLPAVMTRELALVMFGGLALLVSMGTFAWLLAPLLTRSAGGRVISVIMGTVALLVVSIMVANLTTALTLRGLKEQVASLDDLDGRLVATTAGSTASAFLAGRDIGHETFVDYISLIAAFEDNELDAVFFDAPLLAYYVSTDGRGKARLIDRVFQPEDYGIALPQGSDLREQLNLALLELQESGAYEALYWKWFETTR
ncbi:MAG: transporter substrate-binding domain-containing protein [Pseudomonadota bacterium]